MYLKTKAFLIILFITVYYSNALVKITYLSVERPAVNYYNPKFVENINMTANRFGRASPVYYVNLHFDAKVYFSNNLTISFYFLEFLSNRYHRSFVEMHFKFCDLIHKDPFFGAAMKQGDLDRPCPYPPISYHLYNMTVPPEVIPASFPFRKGRILANLTVLLSNQTKERVTDLQIDMELKQLKVKNEKRGKL